MYAVSGEYNKWCKVLSQRKIDTTAIISENTRMVLNVNTVKDFEVAESIMRQMSLSNVNSLLSLSTTKLYL